MNQPDKEDIAKKDGPEHEQSAGSGVFIWEIVKFTFLALIIVIPIRFFIAQPYIVSGSSMDTTFSDGQYVIVDQLTYRFEPPQRGDVIIFKYPKDPSKYFIKRVVGLPGETVIVAPGQVEIKNSAHPNGFTLNEPYTSSPWADNVTTTLGPNHYFVMGDNREASLDSRAWGPVPVANIVGKTFLRLWPVTQAAILPGEYRPAR